MTSRKEPMRTHDCWLTSDMADCIQEFPRTTGNQLSNISIGTQMISVYRRAACPSFPFSRIVVIDMFAGRVGMITWLQAVVPNLQLTARSTNTSSILPVLDMAESAETQGSDLAERWMSMYPPSGSANLLPYFALLERVLPQDVRHQKRLSPLKFLDLRSKKEHAYESWMGEYGIVALVLVQQYLGSGALAEAIHVLVRCTGQLDKRGVRADEALQEAGILNGLQYLKALLAFANTALQARECEAQAGGEAYRETGQWRELLRACRYQEGVARGLKEQDLADLAKRCQLWVSQRLYQCAADKLEQECAPVGKDVNREWAEQAVLLRRLAMSYERVVNGENTKLNESRLTAFTQKLFQDDHKVNLAEAAGLINKDGGALLFPGQISSPGLPLVASNDPHPVLLAHVARWKREMAGAADILFSSSSALLMSGVEEAMALKRQLDDMVQSVGSSPLPAPDVSWNMAQALVLYGRLQATIADPMQLYRLGTLQQWQAEVQSLLLKSGQVAKGDLLDDAPDLEQVLKRLPLPSNHNPTTGAFAERLQDFFQNTVGGVFRRSPPPPEATQEEIIAGRFKTAKEWVDSRTVPADWLAWSPPTPDEESWQERVPWLRKYSPVDWTGPLRVSADVMKQWGATRQRVARDFAGYWDIGFTTRFLGL